MSEASSNRTISCMVTTSKAESAHAGPNPTPVFIGGCDRSGTTMLGSMLGAHADALCVPEAHFLIDVIDWHPGETAYDLSRALRKIGRHARFRYWGLRLQTMGPPPHAADSSYAELIRWIVERWGEQSGKPLRRFWVDQTPWNTRFAATLFELFPSAKMIHIVRDGRAVAASILPLDWGPSRIDAAALWWAAQVGYGLAAELHWGRDRVQRVRYEDVVTDPENTLRSICSHLEIEYQPEMAKGTGLKVPEYTARQHALVGKGLDARRVHAWRDRLTPRQIEIFERTTGDLLQCLGYEPMFGPSARAMSPAEVVRSSIGEASGAIMKRLRHRVRKWKYRTGAAARPSSS